MPSVLSELTRSEPGLQGVLAEGLGGLLEGMEKHLPSRPGVTPRQQAVATLALLVGALTLARATASQPLSDEVLEAARAFLLRPEDPAGPQQ
jgi:TetR/AcrR family transcriptional repressor of nem operon